MVYDLVRSDTFIPLFEEGIIYYAEAVMDKNNKIKSLKPMMDGWKTLRIGDETANKKMKDSIVEVVVEMDKLDIDDGSHSESDGEKVEENVESQESEEEKEPVEEEESSESEPEEEEEVPEQKNKKMKMVNQNQPTGKGKKMLKKGKSRKIERLPKMEKPFVSKLKFRPFAELKLEEMSRSLKGYHLCVNKNKLVEFKSWISMERYPIIDKKLQFKLTYPGLLTGESNNFYLKQMTKDQKEIDKLKNVPIKINVEMDIILSYI
jgi:hypothetical protein